MNSKNKGNNFERTVAKKLSERFKTYTGMDQSFRRNPDSGSYFGGGNSARTETHDISKATFGDIITPEGFAFCVECKAYKETPSLKAILEQKDSRLDKWIKQAVCDSKSSGLIPCIIIKYNRIPIYVITKESRSVPCSYKGWVFSKFDDWILNDDGYFFKEHI